MSKYKIIHEREKCIGCGACVSVCSRFWSMKNDGKSELKGAKRAGKNFELDVDDAGCNTDAAEICPVRCIRVVEIKKK